MGSGIESKKSCLVGGEIYGSSGFLEQTISQTSLRGRGHTNLHTLIYESLYWQHVCCWRNHKSVYTLHLREDSGISVRLFMHTRRSQAEGLMAVVVDEGTAMGVLFEGEEELLLLENLVEWAVVTTEGVGVPAHVLCGWAAVIQSARGSNPRDEEEEDEEIRILLECGMEHLPVVDNSMRDAVEAKRVGV